MSNIQMTERALITNQQTEGDQIVDHNNIRAEFWNRSKRAKREPNPVESSC